MTANICSVLIVGKATALALWTKKRQVFVPIWKRTYACRAPREVLRSLPL